MTMLRAADLRELREVSLPARPPRRGDYSEMFGPGLGLHDFVRRKSRLAFLNALLDNVQIHRNRLLDLEHSAGAAYRKASYEEHRAIIRALESRDGKAARRLMQEHLDRVGREIAALAELRESRGDTPQASRA